MVHQLRFLKALLSNTVKTILMMTMLDAGLNVISNKIKDRLTGSAKTLTNYHIKDIIKAIRIKENRRTSSKVTTRKITS